MGRVDFLWGRYNATGLAKFYYYYGDWVPPPPAPPANASLVSSFSFLQVRGDDGVGRKGGKEGKERGWGILPTSFASFLLGAANHRAVCGRERFVVYAYPSRGHRYPRTSTLSSNSRLWSTRPATPRHTKRSTPRWRPNSRPRFTTHRAPVREVEKGGLVDDLISDDILVVKLQGLYCRW